MPLSKDRMREYQRERRLKFKAKEVGDGIVWPEDCEECVKKDVEIALLKETISKLKERADTPLVKSLPKKEGRPHFCEKCGVMSNMCRCK